MTQEQLDVTNALNWKAYVDLRIASLQTTLSDEHVAGEARAHLNAVTAEHIAENLKLRFELNDRAMTLASASIDKRLEGMNEFRQQLNEQASHFITRIEMEDKNGALAKSVETTSMRLNVAEGKMNNLEGKIWAVGASFSVVVTIINIALHFIK